MLSVAGSPNGQRNLSNAVGQQRLDEALTLVVVGDHGGMPSMQRGKPGGVPTPVDDHLRPNLATA